MTADLTTIIVWKCADCGYPIFNGGGYVGVTITDMTSGNTIPWTPWHDACHPDDDIAYDISVERLRRPEQIRNWTEHLSEKNWYRRSNWPDLLAAHGVDLADDGYSLHGSDGKRNAQP